LDAWDSQRKANAVVDVLRRSLFVTGHAMAVDGGRTINNLLIQLTLMNPIDLNQKIQHNLSNYDKVKATSWKYCARELSGL
jgi:hypothetical protein